MLWLLEIFFSFSFFSYYESFFINKREDFQKKKRKRKERHPSVGCMIDKILSNRVAIIFNYRKKLIFIYNKRYLIFIFFRDKVIFVY